MKIPKAIKEDEISGGWLIDFSFLQSIENELKEKYPDFSCPDIEEIENVIRIYRVLGRLGMDSSLDVRM